MGKWVRDLAISPHFVLVSGGYLLASIPNHNEATWVRTVTIPAELAMDQEYTITARHQSNQDATAILQVPCPKPDLIIGNLQLGSTQPITTHSPITFTATITNIGNLAAVTQFYVSLYANPPAPGPNATHIPSTYRMTGAIIGVSGLQINESHVITLTASAGLTTTLPYDIYVVVDSDPSPTGIIVERHETNNIAGPLTVAATYIGDEPELPPGGDEKGNLIGFTYTPQPGLGPVRQPFTPVYVYSPDNSVMIDQTISAANGFYRFLDLPTGVYNIAACITLDGLEYFALIPGIEIYADKTIELDIYMERTACWTTP